MMSKGTYIQTASIFGLELDNRLAAKFNLGAVLRPEPRHDLDTVRHDRETCVIRERSYVQKDWLESNVVGVVKMFLAGDKEVDEVVDTSRVIAQFSRSKGQYRRNLANAMRSRYKKG